jgi:small subunit ribosomal protein S4
MGLLEKGKSLDDVLTLKITDILNRRLQTLVYKKGLADSPLHARQLIVHGHIAIDKRRIRTPSYMVPIDKEDKIGYYKDIKPKGE